jgi:hypothetical protein
MIVTCIISKTPWIGVKASCINVNCVVDMNDEKNDLFINDNND